MSKEVDYKVWTRIVDSKGNEFVIESIENWVYNVRWQWWRKVIWDIRFYNIIA